MTRGIILLCSLVVSACAFDRFDPRPISAEVIADDFAARSLTSPEMHSFMQRHRPLSGETWPPATWDVESLTLAALYFNPELDAARAKIAIAEASISTAAQQPNPTLQLPFQRTTNPKTGDSPWTLGIALDIPWETAGRRDYRITEARHLTSAVRLQVANLAWSIRNRLRAELLLLWSAGERAQLLQEQVALDQRLVDQLGRRQAIGDISSWAASRQQLILMQSDADLLTAQRQASAAKINVAKVLGVSISALDQVSLDLMTFTQAPPDLPPTSLQLQTLLNRADVGASLAQYAASQTALQLEIAKQYPNINLGPGYTLDQGARRPGFSFSGLTLPIFNHNEGPIAEARGRRLAAEAQVKHIEAQALGDLAVAMTAHRGSRDFMHQQEAQVAAQNTQLARTRRTLAIGEADRQAVTLAERSQLTARLALQDARLQLQQAVGQLEGAMQYPLTAPDAQAPRAKKENQ